MVRRGISDGMIGPLKNARHEEFAQRLARGERQGAAYRAVGYKDGVGADEAASNLMTKVEITDRIASLVAKGAERAEFDIAAALQEWLDIARADPRELIGLRIGCCRFCWGEDHGFQWKEREFLAAAEKAERDGNALPDIGGGFGYRRSVDPHPDCPECDGEGVERVVPRDTSKMSRSALLLYEGVKQTKDGFEIKMKDRAKALENANRVIGAFVERKEVSGANGGQIQVIISSDDANL